MLGLKVPDADKALVITGGKKGTEVARKATFVLGVARHARFLTLEMQEAKVTEQCTTQQGIQVDEIAAVIAFKVGNTDDLIANAAQRFISDQNKMPVLIGQIFAGHLRAIAGAMTVEAILNDRQALADKVLEASEEDVAKLGLVVDSFQIQWVRGAQWDAYVAALAAKHTAAVQRDAAIAAAQANQEAAKAQQESERQQADFSRQTEVTKAQYQAEVNAATAESDQKSQVAQANAQAAIRQAQAEADQQGQVAQATANAAIGKAKAEADQTGPLAQARAQQQVAVEQTKLATNAAELREQQLLAEVVKPAEAQAQQVKILADADAHKTTALAQAAESSNRVSLDQKVLDLIVPAMQAGAQGLQGANLNVLNGGDGLADIVTGFLTQFKVIYETAQSIHAGSSNGAGTGQDRERIAAKQA